MNLHTPVLISHLTAHQILDSRGTPTIECFCHLTDGRSVASSVPSGASTGSHEALEMRDNDPKIFWGQSVGKPIEIIQTELSPMVAGEDPTNQSLIDQILIDADGTTQKKHFGGNTLLAVSLAVAKAGAEKNRMELFQHLANLINNDHVLTLPIPMFNIINGGAHADLAVDFQEFMAVPNPLHIPSFPEQLRFGATLNHILKQVLHSKTLSTAVGDEGGFAPHLNLNSQPIELLKIAGERSQYHFGEHFFVSIDIAANTFYRTKHYHIRDFPEPLSYTDYQAYLTKLINKYPIFSLEDPFPEEEIDTWSHFMHQTNRPVGIIADDLIVTNVQLLQKAIAAKACTGIIVKPNQVGTVSETLNVIRLAQAHQLTTIFSHRSGETLDTFIADLAVGCGADAVKFGAPVRGERVAKYNRLLAIFELLNQS